MIEVRVGPRHAVSLLHLPRFTYLSIVFEKRASFLLVLRTPLVVTINNTLQLFEIRINREIIRLKGLSSGFRFQVAYNVPNRGGIRVPVVAFRVG